MIQHIIKYKIFCLYVCDALVISEESDWKLLVLRVSNGKRRRGAMKRCEMCRGTAPVDTLEGTETFYRERKRD